MLVERLRNALLARWLAVVGHPSLIGRGCSIHETAKVVGSRLSGRVRVGAHSVLYRVEAAGAVSIGYSSTLWGPNIELHSRRNAISIGNYCSIARGVGAYEYLHDYQRLSTYYVGRNVLGLPLDEEIESKGPIEIGHDVWVGSCAHFMSGVKVGNGAVIAANAVVTRDVPDFAIVGGSPARILKYRFDEQTRDRIVRLGWWNWDRETVRRNAKLFVGKFGRVGGKATSS